MSVKVTVTACGLPPWTSVTELGFTLLIAILGTGLTVKMKVPVTELTPLPLAVMVIIWLLTKVALITAWRVMLPELAVPGCVIVAVTPFGMALVASVILPVSFERVRLTVTACELPPGLSVTEPGLTLLIAILGCGLTVKLRVLVTDVTPGPLAVMVITWLLTSAALLAACSVMLPEVPVPGCVQIAVTPLGIVLAVSVTLPV